MRPTAPIRLIPVLLLLTIGQPDRLTAQRPIPDGHVAAGRLSYDGRATLGSFSGTTDSVSGRLNGAPDLARVSGYVAGRAGTLRTGNGKRDRDQWSSLEVDSFPFIRYDLDSTSVRESLGDTLVVTLHGHFAIHGVRRPAELSAKLLLTPTTAHLWTETPLNLTDYKIGGLSKFFGALKMNPDIVVHIDVTFLLSS